jgi:hypothetical protein
MARIPRRISALAVTGAVAIAAGSGLAVVASATATSSLPKITFAIKGNTITVGGALQSGGVNIVSTTAGEAQGQPLLFRLNPGITAAQFNAFISSKAFQDPNQLVAFGSVVFDVQDDRGVVSEVQTTLQAGHYVALDGNPNSSAFTPFTITQAATPAVLPTPGGTISTIDFAIRGAGVLHDGELVRFQNRGFLFHMVLGVRARSLADAYQVVKLARAGKNVPKSLLAEKPFAFDEGLSPGAYQQMTITQHPGIWVVACLMNTQDGREHTQLGMIRIIRIVK